MAIDERARHQLYLRLEEHLGAEAATTLMEHLPPSGWAEVATKRDLDQLRTLTTLDIERAGDQLRAEFYKAISEQTRTIVFANLATAIGSTLAVGGLAFAAARLT
jgi:hypothetical protein